MRPSYRTKFGGGYKLLGACARNFFVRYTTARERSPPTFFHHLPLLPPIGFLELRQFHLGVCLRHEPINAHGSKGGDKRRIRALVCQAFRRAAEDPSPPGKANSHHGHRAGMRMSYSLVFRKKDISSRPYKAYH